MFKGYRHASAAVAALSLTALSLSACSEAAPGASSSAKGGALGVTASFYPLQFVAERVGKDHVTVSSLTKPGAEPHDLELTPKEVVGLQDTDLVLYEKGFQPAVDEAVADLGSAKTMDVTPVAKLDLPATEDGHDHGGEHAGESPDEHAGHSHESTQDPHFWLDPTRLAAVATAVGERLAKADPAHASDYTANAAALVKDLTALDADYTKGLATCASRDLVTGHAAFGYLAKRYDLTQEAIAGISPDAEPSAAQMRDIVSHIKEHGVKTVYAETLVSPALAETIATEAGASVKVLDPVEAITDTSKGKDYLAVMKSNLTTLREGQQCS